jgi:flavorubredoxin
MKVVQDGETLGLGGRSLRFIEAPFLHWPETMFTYLEEEKVLFPCDFFGSHHAGGAFADEVPDLLTYAKKYFGEIMMPYAKNGRNGLAKLEGLDIRMIAPSHGPIHRDPGPIVDAYLSWTSGETVPKVTICYATMWQATKALVDEFAQTLMQEGVDAKVYDLAVSDLASIAGDLVDSRGIVLAGPTVLNGLQPMALHAANVVKAIKPPAKYAVLLSSYGWGGGAVKQALEVLAPLKLDALGAIDVNGYPTKEDLKKTEDLARMMAQRVKEPVD